MVWVPDLLPNYGHKAGFSYRLIDGNESGKLAEIFSRLKSSAYDDRVVNVEGYWRNGYDGDVERCYENEYCCMTRLAPAQLQRKAVCVCVGKDI